jgi:glyoxylase-like metal-dependent hydrolase (beta-lactamase superfamily II)
MIIKTVIVGELETNCYIVASERTKEAMIIDPGDEADKIINAIEEDGLKPKLIINTHCHFDHVGANERLAKHFNIEMFDGNKEILRTGELEFRVIRTPGHAQESICLLGERALFSGDTLFAGDYGRTDLPGGSEKEMESSLKSLMGLPEDTRVYPGHGRSTTIGEEKKLYARH